MVHAGRGAPFDSCLEVPAILSWRLLTFCQRFVGPDITIVLRTTHFVLLLVNRARRFLPPHVICPAIAQWRVEAAQPVATVDSVEETVVDKEANKNESSKQKKAKKAGNSEPIRYRRKK